MAYPPPVPPNTVTGTTPLPTNHPSDHVMISNALTDILNELGSNPKNGSADVTAAIAALIAADIVHTGDIAALVGVDVTHTANIAANAAAIAALPSIGFGTGSGTSNGSGVVTVAHGLAWTPTAVIVSPISPNGASQNERWVGHGGVAVNATDITVGRMTYQDGTIVASTAVTFFWAAFRAAGA